MTAEFVDTETGEVMETLPARVEHTVVKPLPVDEVVAAFEAFQEIKRKLLGPEDIQKISGGVFVKKSGWRKVATAFGLSTEVVERTVDRDEGGNILRAHYGVRAIAPNGRYETGEGTCSVGERRFSKPEHDIPATAHTRAKNRAISDLVGGGEVSAEEIQALAEAVTPQAPAEAVTPQVSVATGPQIERFGRLMTWALGAGQITEKQHRKGIAWAKTVTGPKLGAEIGRWKERKEKVEDDEKASSEPDSPFSPEPVDLCHPETLAKLKGTIARANLSLEQLEAYLIDNFEGAKGVENLTQAQAQRFMEELEDL